MGRVPEIKTYQLIDYRRLAFSRRSVNVYVPAHLHKIIKETY